MSELLFPIATIAITFLVIIPILTLASTKAIAYVRKHTRVWPDFGTETIFALLVFPVCIPLVWLISSVLHQNEATYAHTACDTSHVTATPCFDTPLLLAALILGIGLVSSTRIWREWPRFMLKPLPYHHAEAQRIALIIARDSLLAKLRVHVVHHAPEPVFVSGLVYANIYLDACFVRDSDDAMIRAALLHEYAHITQRDTLRSFFVRLCLSINPARLLLQHDFERWRQAREAQCDSEAVARGGDPLALAEGIVCAARFRCVSPHPIPHTAMLCGSNEVMLKLRLTLLLDGPNAPKKTAGHLALFIVLCAAITLPHLGEASVLELFHVTVERLFHSWF